MMEIHNITQDSIVVDITVRVLVREEKIRLGNRFAGSEPLGSYNDFKNNKGKLIGDEQTLTFVNSLIAGPCAQWVEVNDSQEDVSEKEHFFLEATGTALASKEGNLWDGVTIPFIVEVSGKFYEVSIDPECYLTLEILNLNNMSFYLTFSL